MSFTAALLQWQPRWITGTRCHLDWPAARRKSSLIPDSSVRLVQLNILQQLVIEGVTADRGAVADDDQLAAGAGQGDVHSPRVGEEADFALGVGADKRN